MLIEGLNPINLAEKPIVLYAKLIYLLRWVLTILILVFLRAYPYLQVLHLQTLSFLTLILYLKRRVYYDSWDQFFSLLNEAAVFIYLYLMQALLDDSVEASIRVNLGWLLVIVQVTTMSLNLIRMVVCMILKWKCRREDINQLETVKI